MLSQPHLQTGPVMFISPAASPSTSYSESDFEKRYPGSEKSSPLSTSSPQILHTKPWPERPQELNKTHRDEWRLWGLIVNCVMLMLPLPFFLLFAAAIAVNGNAVNEQQSKLLDFAVKAVSHLVAKPYSS
jgi:hypothetical protein